MTDLASARALTRTMAEPWAQQSRQAVRSSTAFDLLDRNPGNEAIREEVRDLITPDFRTKLVEAREGLLRQLAPANDAELEVMLGDLTRTIALIGGNKTPAQCEEWMRAALMEFQGLPYSLVGPAIADARRTISFSNQFVSAVIASIQGPMAKLIAEAEAIDQLLQIAEA